MEHLTSLAEFYFQNSTREELEHMLASETDQHLLDDLGLSEQQYETMLSMALELRITEDF